MLQILKHFGRGNLVVGRVFEGHFNALLLIKLFGSNEQKERFAADAKNGKLFGVWNTEAADGVKISPLENGKFRIAGAKTFATGTDFVTRPIVNGAMPDGGWQMYVVPLDKVETEVRRFVVESDGNAGDALFKMDFTGAEIEAENLIGAAGDYYRQPGFRAARFVSPPFSSARRKQFSTKRANICKCSDALTIRFKKCGSAKWRF